MKSVSNIYFKLYKSVIFVTKEKSSLKQVWKFGSIFIFAHHLFLNFTSIYMICRISIGQKPFDCLKLNFTGNSYYDNLFSFLIYFYLPFTLLSITTFKKACHVEFKLSKKAMSIIFPIYIFGTYLIWILLITYIW